MCLEFPEYPEYHRRPEYLDDPACLEFLDDPEHPVFLGFLVFLGHLEYLEDQQMHMRLHPGYLQEMLQ